MPRFYPDGDVLSDKLSQQLYDYIKEKLKPVDYYPTCDCLKLDFIELSNIIIINNSIKFQKIMNSLDILIDCRDSFHSELPMKHMAKKYKEVITNKFTKEEYPEVWI